MSCDDFCLGLYRMRWFSNDPSGALFKLKECLAPLESYLQINLQGNFWVQSIVKTFGIRARKCFSQFPTIAKWYLTVFVESFIQSLEIYIFQTNGQIAYVLKFRILMRLSSAIYRNWKNITYIFSHPGNRVKIIWKAGKIKLALLCFCRKGFYQAQANQTITQSHMGLKYSVVFKLS